MKDLLSICCLGYNHAQFLQENLESITKINHQNIEVIVVDDGSQDNSIVILNKLARTFPLPLTVIAQENSGNIGKNFNTALNLTKGSLVTFIALDDVFNPKVIDREIQMMLENKHLAFVAAKKAISIDSEGFITDSLPHLPIENLETITPQDLLNFEYSDFGAFYIQGSIFRKSIIDEIGSFDEDMTGDDIILRTKLAHYLLQHPEWKCDFVTENNVFYRLHENNIHKNNFRQIRIVTEYLDRYWPNKPNPEVLTNWAIGTISGKSFNEALSLFSMNNRTAALLSNKQVQKKLKQSIIKGGKLYRTGKLIKKCIFNKQKSTANKRKITFFGFISFTYYYKNNIHYSKYFN